VVAGSDGAYLILPINGGGSSENLTYLLRPFWFNNRGWQVMRLNASGQLLWSKFIGANTQTTSALPLSPLAFAAEPALLQTQLTASGGVAVLSNYGLHVFDAHGTGTFSANVGATACRLPVDDFYGPSVQLLTDEDVLVVGFGVNVSPNVTN